MCQVNCLYTNTVTNQLIKKPVMDHNLEQVHWPSLEPVTIALRHQIMNCDFGMLLAYTYSADTWHLQQIIKTKHTIMLLNLICIIYPFIPGILIHHNIDIIYNLSTCVHVLYTTWSCLFWSPTLSDSYIQTHDIVWKPH